MHRLVLILVLVLGVLSFAQAGTTSAQDSPPTPHVPAGVTTRLVSRTLTTDVRHSDGTVTSSTQKLGTVSPQSSTNDCLNNACMYRDAETWNSYITISGRQYYEGSYAFIYAWCNVACTVYAWGQVDIQFSKWQGYFVNNVPPYGYAWWQSSTAYLSMGEEFDVSETAVAYPQSGGVIQSRYTILAQYFRSS